MSVVNRAGRSEGHKVLDILLKRPHHGGLFAEGAGKRERERE